MKVYLATAPWSFCNVAPDHLVNSSGWLGKLVGIGARAIKGASPPMGLLYIAASLREVGCEPVLGDGSELSLPEMLAQIERERPDLIGLSSLTPIWPRTMDLARAIKERYDIPIAVGGPFPSSWREHCLEDCDAIDFVIAGEGELIVRDLIDALRGYRPLAAVKGLAWRDNGRIVMNERAPVPRDLDAIPFPARDLVDIGRYIPTLVRYKRLPTTQFFSTRGCPFACNFCWVNPYFRKRSIANIAAEIEECVERFGVRDITFFDSDSTIDLAHTEQIAEAILERGYDLTWAINARVDAIDRGWDEKYLKKLRRAGVWRVLYGIESGLQDNLDVMRKRTKLDQIREAVRRTRKAGISVYGTFIFGSPGETYEDGLRTIEFSRSLGLDFASYTAMTPFPGTTFYDKMDKSTLYGWESFTGDMPSFVSETMTPTELQTLLKLAYRRFYFRPSYLLRRALSCTSLEEIRRNVAGFEGLKKITITNEELARSGPRVADYQTPDRAGVIGCGVFTEEGVAAALAKSRDLEEAAAAKIANSPAPAPAREREAVV